MPNLTEKVWGLLSAKNPNAIISLEKADLHVYQRLPNVGSQFNRIELSLEKLNEAEIQDSFLETFFSNFFQRFSQKKLLVFHFSLENLEQCLTKRVFDWITYQLKNLQFRLIAKEGITCRFWEGVTDSLVYPCTRIQFSETDFTKSIGEKEAPLISQLRKFCSGRVVVDLNYLQNFDESWKNPFSSLLRKFDFFHCLFLGVSSSLLKEKIDLTKARALTIIGLFFKQHQNFDQWVSEIKGSPFFGKS